MYILLVGGGTLSHNLAKDLLLRSHEVLIVERDRERGEELSRILGDVVLRGDGCEASVLEMAGASRADTLIATTREDKDNLTACQVAKARFRIPRTISTINDPRNEPLFKRLGVDVTISVTDIILSNIEHRIPERSVVPLFEIEESGAELVSVKIPPDGGINGKRLEDITLPEGTIVTLVIDKDGAAQPPKPDLVLDEADEVIALTSSEDKETLRATLSGELIPSSDD